jgi:hypothetical protein
MKFLFKFLALVVALNIVRYVVSWPFEALLIFGPLFGAMEKSAAYFNTNFTSLDWVTSYFYNFMMWLTASWVFVKMHPALNGNYFVKSLKVYGLMYLFFTSLSAIYMNHYSHPKDFYFYNILDGLIAFSIVAVANGWLYPLFFKKVGNPIP